ncbi:MAG: sulfite exporter TauE/SafE family protein [Clostridia bacterium]|nr:sulfite exporter TauE/SafE family protein [Clostridia bacterium]
MEWYTLLVCFMASAAAGLGTGFAGMSAAAVIGPVLSVFLGMPIYEAVGIGLISDVLASAGSAFTYGRKKNVDIKNSLWLLGSILAFTVLGSFVATFVSNNTMNNGAQITMIILGLKFIIFPINKPKQFNGSHTKAKMIIKSIIGGLIIGFVCGFVGAGGGMLMLLVLTTFMGYPMHKAVGTSVFIMTFTALTGAISHFTMGGLPNIGCLLLCATFTFFWAEVASIIANKAKAKTLNRVVGMVLIATSLIVIIVEKL